MTMHTFDGKDKEKAGELEKTSQPAVAPDEESKLRIPTRNPLLTSLVDQMLGQKNRNKKSSAETPADSNSGVNTGSNPPTQDTQESDPETVEPQSTGSIHNQYAPYTSSDEHLWHALSETDALVRAQTVRWQHTIAATKSEQYWGMVHVTDAEVNAFLTSPFIHPAELPGHILEALQPYWNQAKSIAQTIEYRLHQTAADVPLRLRQLAWLFNLSSYDMAVVKMCLLPELDSRYRRLYGYLMDDAARTRPTVELVLQVLQPLESDIQQARSRFQSSAPLGLHRIISLADTISANDPLSSQSIQLDPRVVNYLLGNDHIDNRLRGIVTVPDSAISWNDLVLDEQQLAYLRSLSDWLAELSAIEFFPAFYLHGSNGSGQLESAQVLSNTLERPFYIVDTLAALQAPHGWNTLVDIILREAMLAGGAVYWSNLQVFQDQESLAEKWDYLINRIEAHPDIVFLASERHWDPSGAFYSKPFIRIDYKPPAYQLRQLLWESYLPANDQLDESCDDKLKMIGVLANSFQLTGRQIADAVTTARGEAIRRNPQKPLLSLEDLFEGCRRQSSRGLMSFAKLIEPRSTLNINDLILPKVNKQQFDELRARIRHRSKVYSEMGFDQRLSLGKGLIVVFAGSSGTGKTMAAELLAKEYGVQLYKVDLSAVVSKYVGETEKNLSRVFNEAEDANAILLFDEGESLFGKRGEVKEARDRWANIEASFLLQRVEEYRGIVIVTTNRRQDIEPAFWRRIDTAVEFPRPDAEARYHIWCGMFPKELKRPPNEELKQIADKFNLAGGNIKNAALDAAYRALAESGNDNAEISLRHIVLGIAREEQKTGKALTKGDYGNEYYAWVSESLL